DSAEATLNLPRRYGVDDFPIVVQSQQFDSLNQVLWRGMQDSILLVNGTENPMTSIPSQVVRMRLLNASQERNFNFGFTGNKSFYVIGNDGGLLNAPVSVTRIRLSPGERAEILVDLSGMSGQTIYLMSYASEFPVGVQGGTPMPGMGTTMASPINGIDFNILQLNIGAQTLSPILTVPTSLVTVTPWLSSQSNITRNITISAQNMMSMDGPFYFNNLLFDMNRIDYTIPLNNIEIWSLTNQTMVAHPFHIHDVQFFVLDRDGITVQPQESGYKDVVMIAPQETVRFITKFEDFADASMPYMYHCHILMHEDDGMMGQFVVVPNSTGVIEPKVTGNISVYPNPISANELTVTLENSIVTNATVSISNIIGQEFIHSTSIVESNLIKIDVSTLPAGNYFLKIVFGNQTAIAKIFKQ
ncbi:MAG TPA: multicopper oxidase domain-containing protein, partial [Bacteroidia bacterium]|nr:multicopper oxidase domain-containing protein [Bacteroidia bacterium]